MDHPKTTNIFTNDSINLSKYRKLYLTSGLLFRNRLFNISRYLDMKLLLYSSSILNRDTALQKTGFMKEKSRRNFYDRQIR